MKKVKAIIFDMDGTLYQFPGGGTFMEVPFGQAIQRNVQQFIGREFGLDEAEALRRYAELSEKFDGQISLGLEREFGIDRMRFFAETWDLDPAEFIVPEPGIREALQAIDADAVLLSAAPRVWVDRVLEHMGVADIFGDRIYTGEPDIRKPNPLAFQQILDTHGKLASEVVSIGDQEHTDIMPASGLGIRTVRIGNGRSSADFTAPNIVEAIKKLQQGGLL